MRILLTGGTGFIGRALCARLLAGGHRLTVWSRRPAAARQLLPGVSVIEDLAEAGEIEAVVNLAGEPLVGRRWDARRKQAIRDSRLGTTAKLLRWMAPQLRRPHVLVSGSAIGYYGAHGDSLLDESSAAGDDFAATLCRDWEHAAMQAEDLGLRVCRLRTGIVLGADGGALGKMLPPFRWGLGGPMGDGRQWMSWIHREDLIALIQWLLEQDGAGGAYNGTAPEPVRNRDFARTLGRVLHRPALLPAPAPLLRLAFGEGARLLLTGQRVLPMHALVEGFRFRFPDLEDALRDLLARPG
ncbi:TIGR01777 family oxidoreductase [Pseudoxanthomonas sp.]|uniref:TIGR01777 family oxidoreductase n=1 Tax=Pseudoxanthomonas sp. TaxID=1871049 RepID=UPI003F7D5BF3